MYPPDRAVRTFGPSIAEHRIYIASEIFEDLHEPNEILRVVFQVGILDADHVIGTGMIDGDRDGPSPEVDADTQSAITTLFLLEQQLNAARSLPGRDVVLQVMADGGGLLSCFVRVSNRDPTAAAELVLAYASWCAAGMGPSHDPRPLAVGGRQLVDIMPEGAGTSQTPVAVVRDVRILGALLHEFSFDQVPLT